jgi:hypothetical protein
MNKLVHSARNGASKGAALIIVLAFVVLATALGLAYFSGTTTDRQLAHSSYNDTSATLLARSALDITVSDLKQEILTNKPVVAGNIQPARYGVPPITTPSPIPNLIRRSFSGDPTDRTSSVSTGADSANRRGVSLARWNSHYLIPTANSGTNIDSTPVSTFIAPDWVLVTGQRPSSTPAPNTVIGRYAFAVYDEGGLMNLNVGGFPTYASLTQPTLPGRPAPRRRSLAPRYPLEESEIMLAAFTPDDPCKVPKFTPPNTNQTLATGAQCSYLFNTNGDTPQTFAASGLPAGLSINPTNGNITGSVRIPRTYDITLTATNACGTGSGTFHLMVEGFPPPDSTPWPVNLARKGTVAFGDLTTLPSTPTVVTPTMSPSSMGGFPSPTPINKIMGWRNYATTQQSPAPFFPNGNPWFPPGPNPPATPTADLFARNFLGAVPPFTVPYTEVSTAVQNSRTDQAVMNRQELIRLQRTLCTDPVTGSYDDTKFPQSLLQYLTTFSRDRNRPAPDWPQLNGKLSGRFDMNNLQLVIPASWLWPGHHGIGHAYGKQRKNDIGELFGLVWVPGTFAAGTRFTDPNYFGHWRYVGKLKQNNDPPLASTSPDFFQIIDYALNQAVDLPANSPNHMRLTFTVGAAIIDQYDTDDIFDVPEINPDPTTGNMITIIDYLNDGNAGNYAYGVEAQSFLDPRDPQNAPVRPAFAPYPAPLPTSYALLNRRFENVGEFGYAYKPASTTTTPTPTPSATPSNTLDFASAASKDRAMLDFFTYNTASSREGVVDLNTRNGPVLASVIRGAWLRDPGYEILPSPTPAPPTILVSQSDALAAAQAIVQETTSTDPTRGPVLNRAGVARLAEVAAAAVANLANSDEAKKTIARALAEVGQARTWNVMIDVIAQTGRYTPGTTPPLDNGNANKFIVEGEKRYWLHIALDRDDGKVLGSQLEEVIE